MRHIGTNRLIGMRTVALGKERHAFLRSSMRHLAALRDAGPRLSDTDTPFPPDWFDLPHDALADLGAMAYLASLSRYHAAIPLPQAMAQFEVPLRLNQYRIFRSNGYPRAFVTWAGLSPGAERRFALKHQPLKPHHWNSGTSTWVVDFVAPFGHTEAVLNALRQSTKIHRIRTLWHNAKGTRYRILEWTRENPSAEITLTSFGVGQFSHHLAGA